MIGVPYVSQRAREVDIKYESLCSSGLFVILGKDKIYFWVGNEFLNKYLDESNYKNISLLISDMLMEKLIAIYDEVNAYGHEERHFRYMREDEDDKDFQ